MSDKDIRSVAYLYNEMDPSEKLEFERDLQVDENLLIEVETLRKVTTKLHHIDAVQPPNEVVDAVLKSLENRKTEAGNRRSKRFVYYSAAAILLIGFTYGFVLKGELNDELPNEAGAASMGSIQNILPASVDNVTRESESNRVMPWIDENEVLHFRDGLYGSEASSVDSLLRQSYQKLTPITNPTQSPTARQNLHLTGSRR